jgi:phosphatidylglycerol:prolipoprotein diacylglycerol transferase
MRPTLLYLPHEILGIPVFGFGWALGIIAVIAVVIFAYQSKSRSLWMILEEQGILLGVAACIVVFLLPRIETRLPDASGVEWVVGLPIRGYGVMLMLGVVSAMGIALNRCKQAGIKNESFFSLATWAVVAGLLGARLFYVIQKWSELDGNTFAEKVVTAFKVTEGGLVVYGSVIGGLIAILLWTYKNKQPILPIADAITPAFFLGLAFGRIGCLLNGCCYGGLCEQSLPAIHFPSGSPAYMDQLASGKLLGMLTSDAPNEPGATIDRVLPDSWAAQHDVRKGDRLNGVVELQVGGATPDAPYEPPIFGASVVTNRNRWQINPSDVPQRSLAVHPAQVYAAISGLVLSGWTFLLSMNIRRTGAVFGAGLVAYGVLRIIEEIIRVDEAGQFGTALSIAQWISIGGILAGTALIVSAKDRSHSNEIAPKASQA